MMLFFAGLVMYGVMLNLREVSLKEAMAAKGISSISNPSLVVNRKLYQVELYSEKVLVKTYKAVFGKNYSKVKTSKDDNVTPVGQYKICSKGENERYYKLLTLNYPNIYDAAEALARNYINKDEYDAILLAQKNNVCAPQETKLGAAISIQGIGKFNYIFKNLPFSFNWTNGSIAISNENIDELYAIVDVGTPVKISY